MSGQRIFVFGSGPSGILADLAELRLRRLGILTIAMTESGRHLLEKLQLLQPGDVVLATGFHYVRPELVAVLDHARATGCRSHPPHRHAGAGAAGQGRRHPCRPARTGLHVSFPDRADVHPECAHPGRGDGQARREPGRAQPAPATARRVWPGRLPGSRFLPEHSPTEDGL